VTERRVEVDGVVARDYEFAPGEEEALVKEIRRDQASDPTKHLEDLMDELSPAELSRGHDGPAPPHTAEQEAVRRQTHEFLRALEARVNEDLSSQGLVVRQSELVARGFKLVLMDQFGMQYEVSMDYDDAIGLGIAGEVGLFARIADAICAEALKTRARRLDGLALS
jgi:hypothetical protein